MSDIKKISPEFVQSVKKYLEVDDKIKELKEHMKKLHKNTKVQKKTPSLIILEAIIQKIEKSNLPQSQIIIGSQTITISKTATMISMLVSDLLKRISTPKANLYYVEFS